MTYDNKLSRVNYDLKEGRAISQSNLEALQAHVANIKLLAQQHKAETDQHIKKLTRAADDLSELWASEDMGPAFVSSSGKSRWAERRLNAATPEQLEAALLQVRCEQVADRARSRFAAVVARY